MINRDKDFSLQCVRRRNFMKKILFLMLVGTIAIFFNSSLFAQEDWDEEELLDIVSGKVASVDLTGNKLTITDMDGIAQEFVLDPNLTTIWDDTADEEKELIDLTVGNDVVVEFRVDKEGKKIASWIDIVEDEDAFIDSAIDIDEAADVGDETTEDTLPAGEEALREEMEQMGDRD